MGEYILPILAGVVGIILGGWLHYLWNQKHLISPEGEQEARIVAERKSFGELRAAKEESPKNLVWVAVVDLEGLPDIFVGPVDTIMKWSQLYTGGNGNTRRRGYLMKAGRALLQVDGILRRPPLWGAVLSQLAQMAVPGDSGNMPQVEREFLTGLVPEHMRSTASDFIQSMQTQMGLKGITPPAMDRVPQPRAEQVTLVDSGSTVPDRSVVQSGRAFAILPHGPGKDTENQGDS